MPTLAFLLRASANRVYGEAAFDLAAAELGVLDRTQLGGLVAAVHRSTIAGVDYLVATVARSLTDQQLAVLSNLSSLHALFAVDGDRFAPLAVTPVARADEDVVTIQRYSGKTNEAFTHLLVNMALAESTGSFERLLAGERVQLLDPACGRGTSLNRAVVYGMDACGIEIDQRDVEAYVQFILTWMKDKRLKHSIEQAKLRKGRDTPAHRVTVTYGPGKDRSTHRTVDIIHDDTTGARTHLRSRSVDVVVCDLPYGVQHGAQGASGGSRRGPAALLAEALPVWRDLLRPGGAMALGWNRRTLNRATLVELVTSAGLDLRVPADDDSFVHRVDRAIQRDVLIAARTPA